MLLRIVGWDMQKRWQLQHRCILTLDQMREQDDFAIGKFKSVMMNVRLAFVDLLELRHLVPRSPGEDHPLTSDFLFKGKLCAGKQAHGHAAILDRSKTTRRRIGKA